MEAALAALVSAGILSKSGANDGTYTVSLAFRISSTHRRASVFPGDGDDAGRLYTADELRDMLNSKACLATLQRAQTGPFAPPADDDKYDYPGLRVGLARETAGRCFRLGLGNIRLRKWTPLLDTIVRLAFRYVFVSPVATFASVADVSAVLGVGRVLFAEDASSTSAQQADDDGGSTQFMQMSLYRDAVAALMRLIVDALLLGLIPEAVELSIWLDAILRGAASGGYPNDDNVCEYALSSFLIAVGTQYIGVKTATLLTEVGTLLISAWPADGLYGMPLAVGRTLAAIAWSRTPACYTYALYAAVLAARDIEGAVDATGPPMTALLEGVCSAAKATGSPGLARDIAARVARRFADPLVQQAHVPDGAPADALCVAMHIYVVLHRVHHACGDVDRCRQLWLHMRALTTALYTAPASDIRRVWARHMCGMMYPQTTAASVQRHADRVIRMPPDVYTLASMTDRKSVRLLQRYLSVGVSPDLRHPDTGEPLLHLAFASGALDNAQLLLQTGADHNIRNRAGQHVLFRLVGMPVDAMDGDTARALLRLLHKHAGDYIWSLRG